MFRVVFHPSSGAHNAVGSVSGINGTCCERGWPRSQQVPVQASLMPDTEHTVL